MLRYLYSTVMLLPLSYDALSVVVESFHIQLSAILYTDYNYLTSLRRCPYTVSGEHEPNVILKDNDIKYKIPATPPRACCSKYAPMLTSCCLLASWTTLFWVSLPSVFVVLCCHCIYSLYWISCISGCTQHRVRSDERGPRQHHPHSDEDRLHACPR